jgi:uncharacterized membrane protein YdjX (TVP38/TMEM64 family)
LIGRKFGKEYLEKKISYKNLNNSLKTYKYKLIIVGIMYPIFPSNLITLFASNAGIKYKKYLLTIIFSGIPIIYYTVLWDLI